MSPIFCSALLALCGIGVLAHARSRTCELRQSFLTFQQVQIQKLQILQQFNVKWLQHVCELDLFPIFNSTYSERDISPSKWPVEEPDSVPWKFPSNLTIVAIYPPGSPCNGNNSPGIGDRRINPISKPVNDKNSPGLSYLPGNPYPALPPGYQFPIYPPGYQYPTYPPGYPYPIYPPAHQYPTSPPGDQNPTSPPGNQYPTSPPGYPYPTYPGHQYPTSPPGNQNPTYNPNLTLPPSNPYATSPPGHQYPASPPGNQNPTYNPYLPLPPGYPYPIYPSGLPLQAYPLNQGSESGPPKATNQPCAFNISAILGNQPLINSNAAGVPNPSASALPIYPASYGQLPYPLVPGQNAPYVPQYAPYQTFYPRTSLFSLFPPGGFPFLSFLKNIPQVKVPKLMPKYPTPSEANSGNLHFDPEGKTFVIVECPLSPITLSQQPKSSSESDENNSVDSNLPAQQEGDAQNEGDSYTPRSPKIESDPPLVPVSTVSPIIQLNRRSTWASQSDIAEDAKLKTVQLLKKYGYPAETHFVTTEDKYILCLHRIPRAGAPVILLVHGLMSSSASWVQMGPSQGLAYLLYDQGYDVWLLNTRGNIYSPDHKDPNIKAAEYWSFSFHEIGVFDLPSTIDKISIITNQNHIQYIGHSQGSTSFFAMCSELPEYCKRVSFMQALSPTVYMENTQSPVLRFLSLFRGKFGIILNLFGGYRIAKSNNLISQFRSHICDGKQASEICAVYDFVMCGFGWNEVNTTLTPLVVGHASQGASINQIFHYAQMITSTDFNKFDKGAVLNQQQYETPNPPAYNLSQVGCKVGLQYAPTDWLSGTADVESLSSRLPNVVYNYKVRQDGFSHFDYLLSKNVNGLINNRIIQSCKENLLI